MGSHSRTGAGSSSTTLSTPRTWLCSSAAMAEAASSTWVKENVPSPEPLIGIFPAST
jgi:hypothetical protein